MNQVTVCLKSGVRRSYAGEGYAWTAHEDGQLSVGLRKLGDVAIFNEGTWLYAEITEKEENHDEA